LRKVTLYSSSDRTRKPGAAGAAAPPGVRNDADASGATTASAATRRTRLRTFLARYERLLLLVAGGCIALVLVLGHAALSKPPRALAQEDIDAAVLHTLENTSLPSRAAKAHEAVRRSVVRVQGLGRVKEKEGHLVQGVGSGVVIVDTGIILTNMHVVVGAERILVTFADGLESEAAIVGIRPEHDLAVLQAKKLPDDLPAATLRSTSDLAPGDEVIAVGFPFGIGPSVSSGVISGLKREYRSPEGREVLTNLIQFDAAVNPGNSGGPLLNRDGEVVGIVTALLNPTEQEVFIGIGFAVTIESAAAGIGEPPY
jgi:S1-C subfamily serine protease